MSILIFTTKECPVCHEITAGLTRRQIPFEERDLAVPENIVYLRCDAGVFSLCAPIIYDDGRWIAGDDAAAISEFRKRHQI